MGNIAIEVKNLTKTYKLYESNKRRIIEGLFPGAKPHYKEFNALSDVSFTVNKGEIIGIVGTNGSGKSTLLKIITGVLNSTKGEVVVNGRISALLELGAGFNPEYTGIENIYLNGTLNGITREEMSKRIDDIASFADIGDFIYQPVKNYSSGMFVRLAFAVAVFTEPDILIVDEALAVGDAAFQAKCMARMGKIMKSGATVLFVTHDMNTVKRLCQRCIYLDHGKKIMEGPAAEIADVYLRNIRESMNREHTRLFEEESGVDIVENDKSDQLILAQDSKDVICKDSSLSSKVRFENRDFINRVEPFVEGNREVDFVDLKLLNVKGEETYAFEYDEEMTIRMTIRVNVDGAFGVAYHIRDDKNMELLGSSTSREGENYITGKAGEYYLIDFTTKLPVIEGNYNIMIVASRPVIANRTAMFLSVIENATVFQVNENIVCKLWDKVYLNNSLSIKRLLVDE